MQELELQCRILSQTLSLPVTPTIRDLRVEVVWLAYEAFLRERLSLDDFILLLSTMEEDVDAWRAVAESVRHENTEMMR